MSRIKLSRYSRINMFMADYYIGPSRLHQFMRLIIGPALIFLGHRLYTGFDNSIIIAYGGFSILLGIYYCLKPLFWVLTKWKRYHGVDIEVELTDTAIKLREKNKDLLLNFSDFKQILARKTHYSLILDDNRKLYLPVNSLTEEERSILECNITN